MPLDTSSIWETWDHDPSAFNILIVDRDSETIDGLVTTVLGPRGYRTQMARSGREALSQIRRNDINLILLNWQLPDMEGEELLQTLTKNGRRVPTIVMAEPGLEHLAVRAFRLGARGFLSKPLDLDETIQGIRQILTENWGHRQSTRLAARLSQRIQRFVVLHQVTRSFMSAWRPQELYAKILDAAVLVAGAEEGFLLLIEPGTETLLLRAFRGIEENSTHLVRQPVQDTLADRVIQTGKPLRLSQEELAGESLNRGGYPVKGILQVPLRTAARTWGVLSVDRRTYTEPFNSEDEELLTQLAGFAAAALERGCQLEEMRKSGQDQSNRLRGQLLKIQEILASLTDTIPEPDQTQESTLRQLFEATAQFDQLLVAGPSSDAEPES